MDNTEELPTVLSFCSGYAGIERGLDLAGIRHRVIAYVEIEAFAIANLVSKMESGQLDPAPIYTDLKTFPSELFRDAVDILTGGYPCQPFSAAGKRLGEKDPRHLWPYIREHIYTIQPSRVFLENVEGHISMGLSTVISDLEEDGYGATWGIFSAREVGAPHQRKRVYIMADCNSFRCDWGALSNGDSERPMEVEALEGSEQPLVRSEVEGCSGDSGGDMGYSEHDGSLAATERGSTEEASTDNKEGQESSCESEGASQSHSSGDLQAGNISNPRDNRVSFGHVKLSKQGQEEKANNVDSSRSIISDTLSERLERHSGNVKDRCESRWNEKKAAGSTSKSNLRNGESCFWPPEPGVGRVVDGCADRVDRIRLLGNGVVPQTAAKAWQVLSSRLEGL